MTCDSDRLPEGENSRSEVECEASQSGGATSAASPNLQRGKEDTVEHAREVTVTEEMIEALKPFAEIASWYDEREDDSFEIWSDYPHGFINRDLARLKHFRRAAAALSKVSPLVP